jgi:ATP-dependent DNA ligase
MGSNGGVHANSKHGVAEVEHGKIGVALRRTVIPRIVRLPLARLHAPFDHPDWIFEPKLDGFRALAYVEHGAARLVSRNGNTFKSFPVLTAGCGAAAALGPFP